MHILSRTLSYLLEIKATEAALIKTFWDDNFLSIDYELIMSPKQPVSPKQLCSYSLDRKRLGILSRTLSYLLEIKAAEAALIKTFWDDNSLSIDYECIAALSWSPSSGPPPRTSCLLSPLHAPRHSTCRRSDNLHPVDLRRVELRPVVPGPDQPCTYPPNRNNMDSQWFKCEPNYRHTLSIARPVTKLTRRAKNPPKRILDSRTSRAQCVHNV